MKTILGLDGVAAARLMADIKPSAREVRRARVFIEDGVLLDSKVTGEKRNSEATRHDESFSWGRGRLARIRRSSGRDARGPRCSFFRNRLTPWGHVLLPKTGSRPRAVSCFRIRRTPSGRVLLRLDLRGAAQRGLAATGDHRRVDYDLGDIIALRKLIHDLEHQIFHD